MEEVEERAFTPVATDRQEPPTTSSHHPQSHINPQVQVAASPTGQSGATAAGQALPPRNNGRTPAQPRLSDVQLEPALPAAPADAPPSCARIAATNRGGKPKLKEFREFALRGNMVDMAIGILIGGAFTPVIRSLVDDLLAGL